MLSQDIKSKIQQLWNMFWSRGITNPIIAIEQISYLLFIRRLEGIDKYKGKSEETKVNIFKGHEQCMWSNFSKLSPDKMLDCYQNQVFPFIKTLNADDEPFARYMKDAVNEINSPSLLSDAVEIINSVYDDIEKDKEGGEQLQDVQGDIYEYLINELSTSGKNGQFRTPRHIIKFMCDLLNPNVEDSICDLTSGTGGFLLGSYIRILTNHTPEAKRITDEDGLESYKHSSDAELSKEEKEKLATNTLFGFDVDKTMVRIALMNLILHGVYHPKIENIDTLSEEFLKRFGSKQYTVIASNPPFTGKVALEDLSMDLKDYGKKSELLFLIRIIEMLAINGRAAVIIPEGVLFSTGKYAKKVRERLLKDCKLVSVVSLPAGVFKPYAGVKTSILFFRKIEDNSITWHTSDIWCFELTSDGYSLDDNRRKLQDNPLPEAERLFRERNIHTDITEHYYHLTIEQLIDNGLDLHFDRYRKYDEENYVVKPPYELMKAIMSLEKEIMDDLENFNSMI